MYYCHKRNKGILDRQFVTQSVVFRKEMSYSQVLKKCFSVVFPDDNCESTDSEFVANGRGMCVNDGESFIKIESIDGGEERIPWTLQTYIKFSSGRYASRTRLYCVKKLVPGKKHTLVGHYSLMLCTSIEDLDDTAVGAEVELPHLFGEPVHAEGYEEAEHPRESEEDDSTGELGDAMEREAGHLGDMTEQREAGDLADAMEQREAGDLADPMEQRKAGDLADVMEQREAGDLADVMEQREAGDLADVMEQREAGDLADPMEQREAGDLADAMEQREAGDLTDAMEQREAGDLADAMEQREAGDLADPMEQREAGDLADAMEQREAGDLADPMEQREAGDLADPMEQREAGDLADAIEQREAGDLADPMEQREAGDLADAMEQREAGDLADAMEQREAGDLGDATEQREAGDVGENSLSNIYIIFQIVTLYQLNLISQHFSLYLPTSKRADMLISLL